MAFLLRMFLLYPEAFLYYHTIPAPFYSCSAVICWQALSRDQWTRFVLTRILQLVPDLVTWTQHHQTAFQVI